MTCTWKACLPDGVTTQGLGQRTATQLFFLGSDFICSLNNTQQQQQQNPICSFIKMLFTSGAKVSVKELLSSIYPCVWELDLFSFAECAMYLIFINCGYICHIIKGKFVHLIKRSWGRLPLPLCNFLRLPSVGISHWLLACTLLSGVSHCCLSCTKYERECYGFSFTSRYGW